MIYLSHFLIGFIASFVGALPLGMLNLTAMDLALHGRFREVLKFAAGVVLVETVQVMVALGGSAWLTARPLVDALIQVTAVPLFVGLALMYFAHGQQTRRTPLAAPKPTLPAFAKGLILSALNMLAIPFWLFYTSYFHGAGWIAYHPATMTLFVIGIAAGTAATLVMFGLLSRGAGRRMRWLRVWSKDLVAFFFLCLAAAQAVRLWYAPELIARLLR